MGCFVVGAENEDVLVAKIVDDRVLLDTNFGPEGIGQGVKLDANCRYQQGEAYPRPGQFLQVGEHKSKTLISAELPSTVRKARAMQRNMEVTLM